LEYDCPLTQQEQDSHQAPRTYRKRTSARNVTPLAKDDGGSNNDSKMAATISAAKATPAAKARCTASTPFVKKKVNYDTALGIGVVYLPFCYHVVRELVAAIGVLSKFYNISFLRGTELSEHALWRSTQDLPAGTMQRVFGKQINQEDMYCTFGEQYVNQCMENTRVTKVQVVEVLSRIEDFDDIRMIKCKAKCAKRGFKRHLRIIDGLTDMAPFAPHVATAAAASLGIIIAKQGPGRPPQLEQPKRQQRQKRETISKEGKAKMDCCHCTDGRVNKNQQTCLQISKEPKKNGDGSETVNNKEDEEEEDEFEKQHGECISDECSDERVSEMLWAMKHQMQMEETDTCYEEMASANENTNKPPAACHQDAFKGKRWEKRRKVEDPSVEIDRESMDSSIGTHGCKRSCKRSCGMQIISVHSCVLSLSFSGLESKVNIRVQQRRERRKPCHTLQRQVQQGRKRRHTLQRKTLEATTACR
jgi:hypothetical protein